MKSGNGSAAPSPTRGVAQNIAELLHDIVVLAELQWQLLRCDARQSLAQMITPAIVLACAAVLLLSCIPLALVCIALFLAEGTDLSYAQSFSITLAIGMVVGGIVALVSAWMLRRSFVVLRRSQIEFQQNLDWVKRMFKRLGNVASRPRQPQTFERYPVD
jgi:hypothetical protein